MGRRALNPFQAASALLAEAGGVRRVAEIRAWEQYQNFRAQEGDEHISTRYWLTAFSAIAEGTEDPPVAAVEPPGRKRFDANGRPVLETPAPTIGIVSSAKVH